MKVITRVVGKAPEDGYPLFLVYHGGGYNPDGKMNDDQWKGMAERYDDVPGIYCSIRSVSDNESSGQIFSTDISWKFYDRIIENCILYMKANPNQVYIVGYSAGGNGVYQIAPRITDRLASATMSAGHPEGIDLTEEQLLLEANKWEIRHGGISGRTAQQFINYISGLRN